MIVRKTLLTFLCISLLMAGAAVATAQEAVLGKIDFPNSGAPEAQESFLNGVRMLHSFEWDDAAEQFQEAQRIDPDFAMAYWGEAMSHSEGHHFSPTSQDIPAARAALSKLAKTRAARLAACPTEREKGYMAAVEILFGSGSPEERTLGYAEAMGALYEAYPEDHEAATFYALSLMRSKVRGEESLREDMEAGAISQAVFRENPDHPGAAHYIIHSYDDPVHAPIAIYAAHKYSAIAPAAVHALHMPAHIFVQEGMWDYVAERNEASYQASVDRAKRKGLPETRHSFHALYWLQYAYLQQGRYEDASGRVAELRRISEGDPDNKRIRETLLRMEALQTVETQNWKVRDIDAVLAQIEGEGQVNRRTAAAVLLATGMSAVNTDDLATAERALAGLNELDEQMKAENENGRNQVTISGKELAALIASHEGDETKAIELMKEAVAIAETMEPPSGPPGEGNTDSPLKPPHELYAEMLLEAGMAEAALAQFEISLLRANGRVRSHLGAARAAEKVGNTKLATRNYEAVAEIPGAGPDLPGREEAKKYLASAEESQ